METHEINSANAHTPNKKPTPLVTVYVVNHNYGDYLPLALESVFAQTFTDYEVLLIDDGSTDGSQKIVEQYVEHERVFPIIQQNKGLTVTNNIALRLARGKYIMRLDADDYLDPNALMVLATALENNPKVGLVFPDFYEVDETGNILKMVRRHNFEQVTMMDQPAHGACSLIRRKLLQEIGGYDESNSCQDGYDLWIRFIQRFQVKNVRLPLFYYRQHGKSLTRNERRLLDTRNSILRKFASYNCDPLKGVVVVPVRGNQSDPREFALKELGGKKVIDWTLEAALAANLVENIVVTSPDKEVQAHVARTYGERVLVFDRDLSLARVNSFADDTVFDAMTKYEGEGFIMPEAVVILSVDAPFRRPDQIEASLDILNIFEADRVVSVRPETAIHYQHNGGGLVPISSNRFLGLEAEALYRDAGVVQAARTSYVKEKGKFFGGRIGHIIVDQQSSTLLNSEWNWKVAEMLAESHLAKKILRSQ